MGSSNWPGRDRSAGLPSTSTQMPANLDEEGWQEFHAIFAEAADRLYAAEARCVARRQGNGEESEPVSVVAHLNLFERG
jgi:hypothetical protein